MRINSLEIQNFGIYSENKTKVDFKKTPQKPFHIVSAKSGVGKTTMWQALNWVFFGGSVEHSFIEQDKDFCIYNYDTQKKKKPFKIEVIADIELDKNDMEFIDNEMRTKEGLYKILRTSERDSRGLTINEQVNIYKIEGGKSTPYTEDAEAFILNFLPPGIRSYYFFDGANTDFLTLTKESNKVKKAINALSGLDLYNKTIDIIASYAYAIKEPKELTDVHINELKNKWEALEKAVDESKKVYGKLFEKIQALKSRIKIIEPIVMANEAASEVRDKLVRVKNDIIKARKNIKNHEKDIRTFYGDDFCHILLNENYLNLSDNIKEEIEKNEWPQGVSVKQVAILEAIILGNDSKAKDLIIQASDTAEIKPKKGREFFELMMKGIRDVIDGEDLKGADVSVLKAGIDMHYDKKESLLKVIEGLEERKSSDVQIERKAIIERDTIMKKYSLSEGDIENTGTIPEVKELEKKEGELKLSEDAANRINGKLPKLKSDAKDAKDKYEAAFQKGPGTSPQKRQRAVMHNLENKLNEQKETLESINKKEVQANLKEIYLGFWKHDSQIHEVTIDGNYNVSVLQPNGTKSRLSKGQSITLAIAFVISIVRACGIRNIPFAIDCPAGNIDDGLSIDVYKILADHCDQVLLFLLPGREYIPKTEEFKYLNKVMSNGYTLTKSKDSEIKIKEISNA